jgi:hypothetical protein
VLKKKKDLVPEEHSNSPHAILYFKNKVMVTDIMLKFANLSRCSGASPHRIQREEDCHLRHPRQESKN